MSHYYAVNHTLCGGGLQLKFYLFLSVLSSYYNFICCECFVVWTSCCSILSIKRIVWNFRWTIWLSKRSATRLSRVIGSQGHRHPNRVGSQVKGFDPIPSHLGRSRCSQLRRPCCWFLKMTPFYLGTTYMYLKFVRLFSSKNETSCVANFSTDVYVSEWKKL